MFSFYFFTSIFYRMDSAVLYGLIFWFSLFVLSCVILFIVIKKGKVPHNTHHWTKPHYGIEGAKLITLMTNLVLGTGLGKFLIGLAFYSIPNKPTESLDISSTIVSVSGSNTAAAVIFSYLLLTSVLFLLVSLVWNKYYSKFLIQYIKEYTSSTRATINEIAVMESMTGFWVGVLSKGLLSNPEQKIVGFDNYSTGTYKVWQPQQNMALEGVDNCSFLHGVLESIPNDGLYFDLVYAPFALAHLQKDEKIAVLKELKRILKPGGILITCSIIGFAGGVTDILKTLNFKDFVIKHRLSFVPPVSVIFCTKSENIEPVDTSHAIISVEKTERDHSNDENADTITLLDPNEMQEKVIHKTEKHLLLRSILGILTVSLMVVLCFIVYLTWPYLDVPLIIKETARVNKGLVAPILGFAGFAVFQTWFEMSSFCTEKDRTYKELFKYYGFLIGMQVLGAVIFNTMFWLPTFVIELIGWKLNFPSFVKSILEVAILIFIFVNISRGSRKMVRKLK